MNWNTSSFQKGSTEFRTKVSLSKEECIKVILPLVQFYATYITCKTIIGMGKETIKQKGYRLLLDAFQFVGIGRRNRIPNNRDIFKLRVN
jgi:hypothetical protein